MDRMAVAVEAAEAAAEIQRRCLGGGFGVRQKGPVDLVTEVDLQCEAAIRAVLARHCPGEAVLAEEGGGAAGAATRWIVDPLDGTTNYAHGYPAFCVSIAWEASGEVRLGVVLDPLRRELFSAAAGQGARRNGRPVRVSAVADLAAALLATGFPYDRGTWPRNYREFQGLTQATQGVRRGGSAALDLAYVACGRLDGFWEPGLQPWDLAAGTLLVREAGGQLSDLTGNPLHLDDGDVVASNGRLHAALLAGLAAAASGA